jgi:hypothetical protein
MTDQPTAGPTLTMAAALHVLLAQNPELTVWPIRWAFDIEQGITGGFAGPHLDAGRAADLVATLLGEEVTGHESLRRDGLRVLNRFVEGRLGGYRFFFYGDLLLADSGRPALEPLPLQPAQ